MNSENKGYALAVINGNNKEKKEKVYLKPMALYVPDIAAQAVSELISTLSTDNAGGKGFILTVTNNNNGVSVDSEFATSPTKRLTSAAGSRVPKANRQLTLVAPR
ncbi:MAG: DUF1869 domain-containing protein [Klebsiella michiganensis]|nr:DUF1869 domain-containing protein [Klebsiella michiganensis]